MTTQIIDKKNLIFRVGKSEFKFIKPNLLFKDFGTVIKAKVKGSTLGWYIECGFLSYNQLKEELLK